MKFHLPTRIAFLPTLLGFFAHAQALSIDTVYIGDLGNPNDNTGFGSVSLGYNIGKYEVTLNQYTEFLNAVADHDSFGLYNPSMATNLNIAGISRSGVSGSYSYSVLGDGQRPVAFVSWFDAARFMNWLHNGRPSTGNQTAATTEQGAYTLDGATSGFIFKNAGAKWWIPSENEWYKAAYYDPSPSGPAADDYWQYSMRSDIAPTNNSPGAGANRANINDGDYATSQSNIYSSSQNYLTPVGAYPDSGSYYGTFDQGGNVGEWNDAFFNSKRGTYGGAWDSNAVILRASYRGESDPSTEREFLGFRVATVPEPTVGVSLIVGMVCLLTRRKSASKQRR